MMEENKEETLAEVVVPKDSEEQAVIVNEDAKEKEPQPPAKQDSEREATRNTLAQAVK